MVRVRVLTRMPGYHAGAVVDVDAPTAATWLGRGDAERVAPERQSVIETATAAPDAETAVTMPRRGRGR